ncbi:phBC6A51 family helix-turn-helix protein [Lentibacillus cibarius]|uniref:Homeodomain phBC6A51-type domain-containing protein n=1 Tax=Lentibacillus cibarius TaxID=2583219 RepID=A0A5S3QPP4_9BACI|nr:phBC6A51 family helix-turn-helix protein [Lentibacillus cibarius]TMN23161.1 hypothetical protein FFL34_14485 [Lentibacillus cibarius]
MSENKKQEIQQVMKDSFDYEGLLENPPYPQDHKQLRKLTDNQKRFAVLIASKPFHKMTQGQMAELVGISQVTASKYAHDPRIVEYAELVADKQLKKFTSTVYKELQDIIVNSKSEKNKIDAMKLFFQITGKLEESKNITHKIEQQDAPETQRERERRIVEMEKELLDLDVETDD